MLPYHKSRLSERQHLFVSKDERDKKNRHIINERHALCVTNDKETSNWLKSRRIEIKKKKKKNERTKCTERKMWKKAAIFRLKSRTQRQREFWNARKWNNNWLLTAQSHFVAPPRDAVASSHFRWWRALLRLGEIDQAYRPFFCVTTATATNYNLGFSLWICNIFRLFFFYLVLSLWIYRYISFSPSLCVCIRLDV